MLQHTVLKDGVLKHTLQIHPVNRIDSTTFFRAAISAGTSDAIHPTDRPIDNGQRQTLDFLVGVTQVLNANAIGDTFG